MALPAFVLPLAMGIGSAAGGILGGRNRNTTTGSSAPTFNPRFQPLMDILLRDTTRGLNQGSRLPTSFRSAGIGAINATTAGGQAALDANLTSRGLGTSPAAVPALRQADTARQGMINEFENVTIPGIEYEREQDEVNRAIGLLGMGRGTSGTSTTTGTEGGGIGGGLDAIGSLLGFLMANGAIGGGGKPGLLMPAGGPPMPGSILDVLR